MKITIISIGKFENSPHRACFETYLKRIKWEIKLKEFEIKNSKNFDVEKLKQEEAKIIVKSIKPSMKVICLDEKGQQFSSLNFAKLLANFALHGQSEICFVIGGAFGLDDELLKKTQIKMSLGSMTFPHLMVRSILAEQIYRAESIINGHPYHKE